MKNHNELLEDYEKHKDKMEWEIFIAWNLFKKNNKFNTLDEWTNFLIKLNETQIKKMSKNSHFYYFLALPLPDIDDNKIRDEFRLVTIISIMEDLVSEIAYKDFFSWYESNHNLNEWKNYSEIKENYLSKFGATRKFKSYIELYFDNNDIENCLKSIEKWHEDKKSFIELKSIDDLANFFYNMRSEFVHEARMQTFNRPEHLFAGVFVKGKHYCTKLEINNFLDIFERSFINFWVKKTNSF